MGQDRREFLRTSALAGFGGAIAFSSFGRPLCEGLADVQAMAGRRKNVLFIAIDDLRPELGCYGHPVVKSPNIDRLAGAGVLFQRTYCQQAICAPSRASLLTGRRPDTTKIWDLKTHIRTTMPTVVALQQHFKNHGYFSEGMGKLFHPGFEDEASYSTPHRNPPGDLWVTEENLKLENEGGKLNKADDAEPSGPVRLRAHATESADVPDEAYVDGKMAQMAAESLQRLAPRAAAANPAERQPFFLGVGFRKPHLPFCAPRKYWNLYDRARIPLPHADKPKNAPDVAFNNWAELRAYFGIPDTGPCDEATTRELIHGYYACVSFIDAQVGKLLAELDRLNLRKDTIVVVWGDNGWKLGEYSQWSKQTNFELDTRVPLIVADPDHVRGTRTGALTELVDLFPTLSELCGLPVPDGLEGTSLVPLLENPNRPWKQAAFSQYPRAGNIMGYSMRTDRYRYTEWLDRATGDVKARELYDLKNDPLCKVSIALEPQHAQLVAQLHEQMKAGWQNARPPVT